MNDQKYNLKFSLLKISIWLTLILSILKFSGVIDISPLWVFMPIIVSVSIILFTIFLIGLIVVFLVSNGDIEPNKEADTEEKTEEES